MTKRVNDGRAFVRSGMPAVALIGAFGVLMALAVPAAAEVAGGCTGTGTFQTGTAARGPFTAEASALGSEVLELPIADTVHWEGALTGLIPPGSSTDNATLAQFAVPSRPIAGRVVVDLPWPLSHVVIGDWSNESVAVASSGDERYELPTLVPRGVVFKVSGEHFENGGRFCSGSVLVKVEGGPFDSPVLPVTLALTALSAALLVWTGSGSRRVRVEPGTVRQ